jgi:hypothetical protein
MKCPQCSSEFSGKSSKRYCSTKCRVAANRVTVSQPVTVTDTVTDTPVYGTLKELVETGQAEVVEFSTPKPNKSQVCPVCTGLTSLDGRCVADCFDPSQWPNRGQQ